MKLFKLILTIYIPLISLAFMPLQDSWVKDTIYPIRFYLCLALAVAGGLAVISLESRGESIIALLIQVFRQRKVDLLILFVLLYCLWTALSSAFSPMAGYAWLGHPYTQFGSIFIISCWLTFLIYFQAAPVQNVIRATAITTAVMTFLTLLESLGLKPLGEFIQSKSMLYPAALVGHRTHLAGWFTISALAPIFFFRHRQRDGWYWLWLISGLVGVCLCTVSAAAIGLGVSLLVWLLYTFFVKSQRRQALAVTALFFCGLYISPLASHKISSTLETNSPQLKDYSQTQTLTLRFYLWKAAFRASLERPIIGWGDETYGFQAFKYFSESEADNLIRGEIGIPNDYNLDRHGFTYFAYKTNDNSSIKSGTLLYVRPHNVLLDEIYSHGYVGCLLMMFIAYLVIIRVVKFEKRSTFLFLIAFSPYFIYLNAWFYVASVTPLYFALLGCALRDVEREGVYGNA